MEIREQDLKNAVLVKRGDILLDEEIVNNLIKLSNSEAIPKTLKVRDSHDFRKMFIITTKINGSIKKVIRIAGQRNPKEKVIDLLFDSFEEMKDSFDKANAKE